MRKNYARTNIAINFITSLRAYPMTYKQMKEFLRQEYRRNHILRMGSYDICDKTVQRWVGDIKRAYPNCLVPEGEDLDTGETKYRLYIDNFPAIIEESELQALNNVIENVANNKTIHDILVKLKDKLQDRFDHIILHKTPDPKRHTREINEADAVVSSERVVVGPRANYTIDPTVRKTIDKAVLNSEKIIIEYHGKKNTVRPLGVFSGDNNTYMLAIPERNGAPFDTSPWTYKMSDITDAKNTHKKFPSDPTFSVKEYTDQMFGVYNDHKTFDIVWRVDKSVVADADRYTFHPSQKTKYNPDGSMMVYLHCGGLDAICSHLFQWNGKITPIAPAELVEYYRKKLKKTLETLPQE